MMQPILDAQRLLWPTRNPIKFEFLHFGLAAEDSAALNSLIDQVEALVQRLENQGYDTIVLPDRSKFLEPFILGTGGSLAQPIDVRHRDVVFGVVCPGTAAVDQAANVFRFCDTKVDSLENLGSLVGSGGNILVLFETDDPTSEQARATFQDRAQTLNVAYSQLGIAFDGTNYSWVALDAAANAVAALPTGSVVVHIPSRIFYHQAAYTDNVLAQGHIFVPTVTHFSGNYFPTSPIPVALQLGVASVSKPSLELEQLGFPITTAEFFGDPRANLFIEIYGWMANRGKFIGVDDHHLQFDMFGTRIAYEIENHYIPADTTGDVVTGERQNPRWLSERFPWSWSTVFK